MALERVARCPSVQETRRGPGIQDRSTVGGKGRGKRQGTILGEPRKLTVTVCTGGLLEKTLMSSLRRKLWGAHVDIHPVLLSTYSICGRTRRHGQGLGNPPAEPPSERANPVQSL